MKPGTLTSKRILLPALAIGIVVLLASWDYKQAPAGNYQDQTPTDTLPKKKKATQDRKVRDLDDVIDELNEVNIDAEMEKVSRELAKALKEIDGQKIQMEIQKAMKEVDMAKIQGEIEKAMKEVDFDKMKKDIEQSMAKIDWDKIKKELDEVKKIDFSKMQAELKEEMAKVEEEMKNIRPQIEKEMNNAKVELGKAKVEIEKAKAEMKEYKEFVDGLDKDGLINKKEEYSIKHQDGELTINGKKVSDQVYSKYRSFLEKHKKFNIEKTADDFDIDMD